MSATITRVSHRFDDGYRHLYRDGEDYVGTDVRCQPEICEVSLTLVGNGAPMAALVDLARALERRLCERLLVDDKALTALAEVMRVPEARGTGR